MFSAYCLWLDLDLCFDVFVVVLCCLVYCWCDSINSVVISIKYSQWCFWCGCLLLCLLSMWWCWLFAFGCGWLWLIVGFDATLF